MHIGTNSVNIPRVDGKDLWISNYGKQNSPGYTLIDKNGNPNLKRYKATFDYSLDLIKLRDVYSKVYRNNRFSYIEKRALLEKEYCNRIINVTFKYSVKSYNRTGKDIFLQLGISLDDVFWIDCLGYYNGNIVAVKVNTPITSQAHIDRLPQFFSVVDNQFKAKQNIATVTSVAEIRQKLYQDGFVCNGIKYVRWKRSNGSSRVGKCIFIDEALYSRMHTWETCGLNIRRGAVVDLAGFESYISLTSSSIIGLLHIEPKNILVIDDYESVFADDVINVTEKGGALKAKRETINITNSIWDGESLIDKSLMGEYANKGMFLLRNRFFKSCCFNSNIQQWFADNNITKVSQLKGHTLATQISDIKLITTPSSIKYLKFSTLDKWLEKLEPNFGVVKFEKPTRFMDGKLVQTHYQLINSIQLSKAEMQTLLQPTFDFMTLIKSHPEVLRHWIKFKIEDEIEVSSVKSKTDVIYKMLSVNEDFYKTKLYDDFKLDFLKSFTKNLKCGHVLINGNYSVLCGNPVEMLKASIGSFDGTPPETKNCVHNTRFEFGKTILGSRSPHPTISNVLLVTNQRNEAIEKYMNATNEIVYINSIGENILQQLAGSDFDSDSLLLTDNEVLVTAAMRNNGKFKVAVCNIGGDKQRRRYITEDLADLDIKTSKNLIGDIINMAQELNTQIWNRLACGENIEEVQDTYLDSCKLSIMSGLEIDKAKKEFVINNANELMLIRAKHQRMKDGKPVKPNFFNHISRQKKHYNPSRRAYVKHHTAMDYLQQCVNSFRSSKRGREQKIAFIPFSDIINKANFNYGNVADKQIVKLLDSVSDLNTQIKAIYSDKSLSDCEKYEESQSFRQPFIDSVGEMQFNHDTLIAILQTIEKDENRQYRRLLFYTLFGYPNTSFYDVILNSRDSIRCLAPSKTSTNIQIYGEFFTKTIQFCPKNEPK